MKENKNKFNAFNKASSQDWEVAARNELNGANPWEKLEYKGQGWSIRPFYDQNDTTKSFSLSPAENNFLGARAWYNCPAISVIDSKKANQKALEYLSNGADGIFFELHDDVDFSSLLNGIDWRYCSLNFLAKKNQESIEEALADYIAKEELIEDEIHGAFFSGLPLRTYPPYKFRLLGFQIEPSTSPVEELVSAFATMITTIKDDFPVTASQVAFSVPVGNDFFLEIAKLRAFRTLWARSLAAANSKNKASLFLHAFSPPWNNEKYQPHENMLKSTTAAMSAILGGCDVLTIVPEDNDNSTMARIGRNVSNILREESHFSKVADPLSGSYYLDSLTEELTASAWPSIEPYIKK